MGGPRGGTGVAFITGCLLLVPQSSLRSPPLLAWDLPCDMAVTLFLLLAALCLAPASNLRVKFVGDSVEFTVPGACADGKLPKLVTGDEPVAQLNGSAWTGHGRFAQRVHNSSGSSLILIDANVNDGGLYEFLCGGDGMGHRDSLKVVPQISVRVTEGGTAVLPGYMRTVGKLVKTASWRINGTVVCSQSSAGEPFTCGHGYNHSASVAPGGNVTGDFSLTLREVKREQGGNYTLCVEFESENTECAAVSLEVSPVPTRPPKEETSAGIAVTVVLSVLAAAGWLLFFVFLALWLRSRGAGAAGEHRNGEHRNGEHRNGDIELGLLSNGNLTGPQHGRQHEQRA